MPTMIKEKALPVHHTPTSTTAKWNASQALSGDRTAAELRYASAWMETGGDVDLKATYKLPHHEATAGSAAIIAGVNNALARLSQTDIPDGDRSGVERHLRAHRKDAGLEETMSEEEILTAVVEIGYQNGMSESLQVQENHDAVKNMSRPLRGATSFTDLRQGEVVRKITEQVEMLTIEFQHLIRNVMSDPMIEDKAQALRDLNKEFIALIPGELAVKEQKFIELSEAETGNIIGLVEQDNQQSVDPLLLDVVIIQPGWGNTEHNNFYPAEMLKESAAVFSGAKMYTTDHREDERSVRTEVSQILECPVAFTENGAPIARVGVFDETFAHNIRARAHHGVLDGLHCSIKARGVAEEDDFELNGRTGRMVTSITEVRAVDWVTRAGAGGHALNIIEGENSMAKKNDKAKEPDEVTDEVIEEVTKVDIAETDGASGVKETPAPVFIKRDVVSTILSESTLPDAARVKLAYGEYESEDKLKTAVQSEIDYITTLTGAGQPPTNMGTGRRQVRSLEEVDKAKDAVNAKWGMVPKVKVRT